MRTLCILSAILLIAFGVKQFSQETGMLRAAERQSASADHEGAMRTLTELAQTRCFLPERLVKYRRDEKTLAAARAASENDHFELSMRYAVKVMEESEEPRYAAAASELLSGTPDLWLLSIGNRMSELRGDPDSLACLQREIPRLKRCCPTVEPQADRLLARLQIERGSATLRQGDTEGALTCLCDALEGPHPDAVRAESAALAEQVARHMAADGVDLLSRPRVRDLVERFQAAAIDDARLMAIARRLLTLPAVGRA